MEQLEAPFTAGRLAWVRCGPSYRPRLPHGQMKVSVLLGKHTAGWRELADLAAVAGVSTSHFAKAFHRSVGETPHRFLVRWRLEHACKLLRATREEIPLAEVAFQTGFSSQSHFTRCFRTWCGLTPGEFLHQERSGSTRT